VGRGRSGLAAVAAAVEASRPLAGPACHVLRKHVVRGQRPGERRRDANSVVDLWAGLIAGRWTVVDRWEADGRRHLVARRVKGRRKDPQALTPREQQVVMMAIGGASNVQLAHDLSMHESTVATHMSRALRKLGLERRQHLMDGRGRGQVTYFKTGAGEYAIHSVEILGRLASASKGLTRVEQEVALLAAAGFTDAQIGERRGTSPRTVANQLRSVFQKLGVRSRSELALRLEHDPDEAAPSEAVPA
jgi:DNA-binding CsgD family transcriptional regulator